MTTIFDAHSHIQYPAYDADRDAVIARARVLGVKMIVSGTQPTSSVAAIRLAEQYPHDVWATAGFHPNHAILEDHAGGAAWYHDKNEQREAVPEVFDIEEYRKLGRNRRVVAIGECGLDYFRLQESMKTINQEIKGKQKEIFSAQIELAKELKKPLVIHARPSKGTDDAYEDVLTTLRDTRFALSVVFHFYAGSLTMTKKLVDAGSYFTFGGVTTFGDDRTRFKSTTEPRCEECARDARRAEDAVAPALQQRQATPQLAHTPATRRDTADCPHRGVATPSEYPADTPSEVTPSAAGQSASIAARRTFETGPYESIRAIPLERIMLETDAPYVAPVPYRGKRNEPAYVVETAKRIAVIKGISYDDVARQTTQNVLTVFGIAV